MSPRRRRCRVVDRSLRSLDKCRKGWLRYFEILDNFLCSSYLGGNVEVVGVDGVSDDALDGGPGPGPFHHRGQNRRHPSFPYSCRPRRRRRSTSTRNTPLLPSLSIFFVCRQRVFTRRRLDCKWRRSRRSRSGPVSRTCPSRRRVRLRWEEREI